MKADLKLLAVNGSCQEPGNPSLLLSFGGNEDKVFLHLSHHEYRWCNIYLQVNN